MLANTICRTIFSRLGNCSCKLTVAHDGRTANGFSSTTGRRRQFLQSRRQRASSRSNHIFQIKRYNWKTGKSSAYRTKDPPEEWNTAEADVHHDQPQTSCHINCFVEDQRLNELASKSRDWSQQTSDTSLGFIIWTSSCGQCHGCYSCKFRPQEEIFGNIF